MRITVEELERRIAAAADLISPCRLCPRECLAHRTAGETGHCGATTEEFRAALALAGHAGLHRGF